MSFSFIKSPTGEAMTDESLLSSAREMEQQRHTEVSGFWPALTAILLVTALLFAVSWMKHQNRTSNAKPEMTNDTKQFFQFIAAVLGLGLLGGAMVNQPWMRGFELPFGIAWILCFLVAVGFIVNGGSGAKALVSYTLMMWGAAAVCAAFIAWLVIAGAAHSL